MDNRPKRALPEITGSYCSGLYRGRSSETFSEESVHHYAVLIYRLGVRRRFMGLEAQLRSCEFAIRDAGVSEAWVSRHAAAQLALGQTQALEVWVRPTQVAEVAPVPDKLRLLLSYVVDMPVVIHAWGLPSSPPDSIAVLLAEATPDRTRLS